MNNKLEELIVYLKDLGLENIGGNEKKILLDKLNSGTAIEQIKKELELLLALNKVLISSYSKVSLSNMVRINEEIDSQLIIKLFMVYNQIKSKSNDEVSCLKAFKNMATEILNLNKKTNVVIEEDVSENFKRISAMRNALYLTMLDKDKADALLNNCIKRSKMFLNQCDVLSLEKLIGCLKKNYALSNDELVDISKRCATFFAFCSVAKLDNISKTINGFRDFIGQKLSERDRKVDASKLLARDFKDILINSSSIASSNPDVVKKTVKFLTGYKIGDIINSSGAEGEIRGNFTPLELAKIYNESITSLAISVEKIKEVCLNLSNSFKRCFDKELDLNNLINGHNFTSISQLDKGDYVYGGKVEEIFNILSMFISKDDMENLLRNNFSFLIASVNDVKKSLKEAVLDAQNKDELRKNVLHKIRNHFDMYESYFPKSAENGTNIKIGSLNKIGVKNISEEDIEKILKKLNTTSDDIDEWKKKWNKEEKEYRDLQVQIDLEDILSELEGIEELLPADYRNAEQLIDETLINKNLLFEVKERYEKLIIGKKFNKNLSLLAEEVANKINHISDRIDSNIGNVIKLYGEELDGFNKRILELEKKKKEYYKNFDEIRNIEDKLSSVDLSYEEVKKTEEIVVSVIKFLNYVKVQQNKTYKNEKKADKLLEKFADSLDEIKKLNINLMNSASIDDAVFARNGILSVDSVGDAISNNRFFKHVKYNQQNDSSYYLFLLFVKVLYDDDLIDYIKELDDVKNEEKISYDVYKNKYLNSEQSKLADQIYAIYTENCEIRRGLFVNLLEYLECYEIDAENVETIDEAYALLENDILVKKDLIEYIKRLFMEKQRLNRANDVLNIAEIKESLKELENNISNISLKITDLHNVQIKR